MTVLTTNQKRDICGQHKQQAGNEAVGFDIFIYRIGKEYEEQEGKIFDYVHCALNKDSVNTNYEDEIFASLTVV